MNAAPFVYHDGSIQLRDGSYRERYAWHYRKIAITQQFKAALRAGKYAWPGGYETFFLCDDGAALCHDCARANFRPICEAINGALRNGWRVLHCESTAEYDPGDDILCEQCNRNLTPANEESET